MAALHAAAGFGHAKVVQMLLAHGANVGLLTGHAAWRLCTVDNQLQEHRGHATLIDKSVPIDLQDTRHGLSAHDGGASRAPRVRRNPHRGGRQPSLLT